MRSVVMDHRGHGSVAFGSEYEHDSLVGKHDGVSQVPEPGAPPSAVLGKYCLPLLRNSTRNDSLGRLVDPNSLDAGTHPIARWIEDLLGARGVGSGFRFLINTSIIGLL